MKKRGLQHGEKAHVVMSRFNTDTQRTEFWAPDSAAWCEVDPTQIFATQALFPIAQVGFHKTWAEPIEF